MTRPRLIRFLTFTSVLAFTGYLVGQQEGRPPRRDRAELTVEHPDCAYFGPQRERFVTDALQRSGRMTSRALSETTERVVRAMAVVPGGSQTYTYDQAHTAGTIDSSIYADF